LLFLWASPRESMRALTLNGSGCRCGLVAAVAVFAALVGDRPTGSPHLGDPRASQPPVVPRLTRDRGLPATALVSTPRGAIVADELIVETARDADAAAAIADVGGEVVWIGPRTGRLRARFATPADAAAARAELAADPRVASVIENRVARGTGIATSPAQLPGLQWYLRAMQLQPSVRRADGVVVAVIDTGVAYESWTDASGSYARAPDLAGVSFVAGWDFVHDDAHPDDDHGHGTHVTGIIASSSTIVPVAPGVRIMPIKVLDRNNLGTELGLAEGLLYAVDHGADVINLSLSFDPGYFPSRFLQEAIDHAARAGVVVVAAAGNQGGDAVTYPAAFRDVIAVGASRIWSHYKSPTGSPWFLVELFQRRAEYSNQGYALDLVAPAGAVDGDANRDGMPEAVVAQTIDPADPTQFQYVLWAGTSQAAAEVSGAAALVLAANRSLTPFQVRALLGEAARPELGGEVLSPLVGRGFLRVDDAVAAATTASATADALRPRFGAALRISLVDDSGVRRARATVEILDAAGRPVPGMQVYGTFTGGASASKRRQTGPDGQAVFVSPSVGTAPVVAFQVDAVTDRWLGNTRVFDRPHGALRIDSCSLEVLSRQIRGSGIATSPVTDDGGASGQGIATSPGPTGLFGLRTPRVGVDVDTVMLLNYSWNGATSPMAIAVDPTWFAQTFPDAPVVQSSGQGIATSPLQIDAATSFGVAVPPPTAPGGCARLLVQTFRPGDVALGAAPVVPDPSTCGDAASCAAQTGALGDLWDWAAPAGQGIATSPRPAPLPWDPQTGMTQAAYAQAVAAMGSWADFAALPAASPVAGYDGVLEASGLDAVRIGAGATAADGAGGGPLSCGPQPDPGVDLAAAVDLVADSPEVDTVCAPVVNDEDAAGAVELP